MKKNKGDSIFVDGSSYTNVYFLKIDASGHSNIVINNPEDKVNKLFDLLEENIYSAVEDNRRIHSCQYAEFWGWQGDGGLCIIWDTLESKSLATALDSSFSILDYKLSELRDHLKKLQIKGDLHLRVAIHKGAYLYKGDTRRGSIHSKDLNFVSHLETRTPRDSIAVSEDVFTCCDSEVSKKFRPLNLPFEGKQVYLYNKNYSSYLNYDWFSKIDFHQSSKANVFGERLSEKEKATFIKYAEREIIDLGTAARTCSYYLGSTQRPTYYKDAVLELLKRGVDYTCLILNPDSDIARYYGELRNEDLPEKIKASLELFSSFATNAKDLDGKFKILLYSKLPYFACIAVDRDKNGSIIFSPYMPHNDKLKIERADTMHYLFTSNQHTNVFKQINLCITDLLSDTTTIEVTR